MALRVKVDASGVSAESTLTVSYALDGSDTWSELGVIQSTGLTLIDMPSAENPVGVKFESIRFRVDMSRGSVVTASPNLHALTLEFQKRLPRKRRYSVMLDLSESIAGVSRVGLREALVEAESSPVLVPFTLRSASREDTVFVEIENIDFIENTGSDARARALLSVVEL